MQPATPLQPIGYVDVTDQTSGNTRTFRVRAFRGQAAVEFLDYSVTGAGSPTAGSLSIAGFVQGPEHRVNFTLASSVSGNVQSGTGSILINWQANVPTRQLSLALTATIGVTNGDENGQATVNLTLQQGSRTLALQGSGDDNRAEVTVRLNGALFATLVINQQGQGTWNNSRGQPLSSAERLALEEVLTLIERALVFFGDLLNPVLALL